MEIGFKLVGLVLDAVEEKEMIVVLALLMGRGQWGLGVQWGEAQEQKSFHQVGAVGAVLADAQHNTIAIQLLFGELQKRQERLLAGLVRQRFGQGHVQDVAVVIQDLADQIKSQKKVAQLKISSNSPSPNLMKSYP